jgi:restriction system protein
MPIPDYQSLMLPVLAAARHGEVRIASVIANLADKLALTQDERATLLPSGKQTIFANRVHWAKTYLGKAGLIESTRRGHFRSTARGKQVLDATPERIDNTFLDQFQEFRLFTDRSAPLSAPDAPPSALSLTDQAATPDEVMRGAHRQIEAALAQDLLERVRAAPPEFFEQLIVNLLLAMGYGGSAAEAGRAIGRSGDDGVDGVIDQDENEQGIRCEKVEK